MRRKRITIGWPRRDPRRYRFALPNAIWEFKLKPVAFVIFSWLCYHNSHGSADALTAEVVADFVHLSENTAEKYLAILVDKGLITVDWSLTLDSQRISSNKFFTLPNEVFLLDLPPSAFMVYAYLLLIEDRRTHTCHPSYNTIATATGMAKNTVMKSIGVLLEIRLIAMERSQYFDKRGMKWNGNNLYTVLPIRGAAERSIERQIENARLEAAKQAAARRLELFGHRAGQGRACGDLQTWEASEYPGELKAT